MPCDILVPAAIGGVLNEEVARKVNVFTTSRCSAQLQPARGESTATFWCRPPLVACSLGRPPTRREWPVTRDLRRL